MKNWKDYQVQQTVNQNLKESQTNKIRDERADSAAHTSKIQKTIRI